MYRQRLLTIILIVSVIALCFSLGPRALWDPDEGRYAEMAREILVLGDWVTPHLNYLLYFEKPMMFMWLEALSFKIFGVSEGSAHLVSIISALGGAALTGFMAWRLWGARAGIIAALTLITSLEYFFLASAVDINMPLNLFITAALVFFWLGYAEKKTFYFYFSWSSMALAVLTKGPIGMILPVGIVCVYILLTRRFSLIRQSRPVSGTLVFLAVAAPWYILVCLRNPDFFSFFFINQNIQRYAASTERYQPFFFFIPVILGGALPWTFFLPSAIREIRQSKMPSEILYIIIWFTLIFLFFTPSRSKLATYVLPCFPPIALILGYAFRGPPEKGGTPLYAAGILWMCLGILLVIHGPLQSLGIATFSSGNAAPLADIGIAAGTIIVFGSAAGIWLGRRFDSLLGTAVLGITLMAAAIAFAPHWDTLRSTKSIVQGLQPGAKLYAYDEYHPSSSFYAGRQVGLVDCRGELVFGIKRNKVKGYVLSLDELAEIMNTDKDAYCLTNAKRITKLRKKIPALAVVKQSNDLCLLHVPGS